MKIGAMFAAVLNLLGTITYVVDTVKGKARPKSCNVVCAQYCAIGCVCVHAFPAGPAWLKLLTLSADLVRF